MTNTFIALGLVGLVLLMLGMILCLYEYMIQGVNKTNGAVELAIAKVTEKHPSKEELEAIHQETERRAAKAEFYRTARAELDAWERQFALACGVELPISTTLPELPIGVEYTTEYLKDIAEEEVNSLLMSKKQLRIVVNALYD